MTCFIGKTKVSNGYLCLGVGYSWNLFGLGSKLGGRSMGVWLDYGSIVYKCLPRLWFYALF